MTTAQKSILEGKKFFITDVDGTIVDRVGRYLELFGTLAATWGIDPLRARLYLSKTLGMPLALQLKLLCEQEHVSCTEEAIQKFVKNFFIQAEEVPVVLFPQARLVFEKLCDKGFTLFASSGSNTGEIKRLFEEQHFPPFTLILGSDETPKGPEHIVLCAQAAQLPLAEFARQAVFLGDGTVDMQIARATGVTGIGVTTSLSHEALMQNGATSTIATIEDILLLFQ